MTATFRLATEIDFPLIRDMLRDTFAAEAYYALTNEMSDDFISDYWFKGDANETWIVEENGQVLGTYYMQRNRPGLGGHVANCGYIVSPHAQGKGIGRKMGEHSLARAGERGFRAMQFNFVVSTNEKAVKLWKDLGFRVIGTVPGGYHFQRRRYDDAYIMFREIS